MSQFEYLAVLVSVITGLGVVHLLMGVARFFTTRGQWVDVIDTRLKMRHGLSGFGVLHVVLWFVLIVGSLTAARSSRHRVQAGWGIGFFAVMSLFEYLNFSALRAD